MKNRLSVRMTEYLFSIHRRGGRGCLEGHINTLMKDTAEPNNIWASMTNQYLWREIEVGEEMRFQLQSEW